jgi:hypothetical protein
MKIIILNEAGSFAENKDVAALIREKVLSALEKGETIIFDFKNVEGMTQSFAHALLAKIIRIKSASILEKIEFKNCNKNIQSIIMVVTDYLQE